MTHPHRRRRREPEGRREGRRRRRSRRSDGKSDEHASATAIVAVGIVPNTENIGLEALGVKTDRGHIDTDGDVPHQCRGHLGDRRRHRRRPGSRTRRATRASSPSRRSPELGSKDAHPHPIDPRTSRAAPTRRPQVASVGLTEAKAKEAGYEVKVGKFPFIGNGKAIALGETEGFVKTVFDAKTGELLGAHMIGAEVTELIQGYAIGKTAELDDDRLHGDRLPAPDAERDDARERARRVRPGDPHLNRCPTRVFSGTVAP